VRIITNSDLKRAVEEFLDQHRGDLPFTIQVNVLDTVVPGTAMVQLQERQPSSVPAIFAHGIGVGMLRVARRLDRVLTGRG